MMYDDISGLSRSTRKWLKIMTSCGITDIMHDITCHVKNVHHQVKLSLNVGAWPKKRLSHLTGLLI